MYSKAKRNSGRVHIHLSQLDFDSWQRKVLCYLEADFTQDKVIQFSQELKKHSYRHNIISLEPDWQQDSPFLSFNSVKFLDPKHMMAEIHKGGYKLDLFVHPYVKNSSSDFDQKELFIKNSLGSQLMVKSDMFYKDRAIVDFSNVKARDWFEAKLTKLKTDFDIDSFIFNAIAFYDNHFTLSNPTIQKASVLFGEQYVRMASRFGLLSTVREGHKTQDLSIFTRMIDRQADWTYQKGLKSLIPTALAMSIGGYSFIIPDIVGGRWGTPTEELYIRWAQASTFLPTMQFAIPPWDFGDKTATLVKNLVNLHTDHAATFMDLARKRVKDGTPILRPMWFVAPDDDHTYKIDDQFMVGDDLLVAPVLEEGKKERNVYLPKGVWIDQHGKYYYGPIQVTVSAPIEELPFFKRHIV